MPESIEGNLSLDKFMVDRAIGLGFAFGVIAEADVVFKISNKFWLIDVDVDPIVLDGSFRFSKVLLMGMVLLIGIDVDEDCPGCVLIMTFGLLLTTC